MVSLCGFFDRGNVIEFFIRRLRKVFVVGPNDWTAILLGTYKRGELKTNEYVTVVKDEIERDSNL